MVTINDVAKLANVSKSTVSNVFSKKKYISPELTKKVLKAAEELDFHQNYFAKTLATKTSKIIGISIELNEEFHTNFQQNIIRGILSVCAKNGYYLLVEPNGNKRDDYLPMDGMIMLNPEDRGLSSEERPHVWVGVPPESEKTKAYYVDNDNFSIGKNLTSILNKYHQRVAFINTYAYTTVAPQRHAGYLKAIEKYGLADLHFYTPKDMNPAEFAYEKTKELLICDIPIDAIILDSDLMALSVYKLVNELNFEIPKDLSVVAIYSSIDTPNVFYPELTTVNLNEMELGKAAAKLLINQLQNLDNNKLESIQIPSEINIRSSIKF